MFWHDDKLETQLYKTVWFIFYEKKIINCTLGLQFLRNINKNFVKKFRVVFLQKIGIVFFRVSKLFV
jgi:hypothetical protein